MSGVLAPVHGEQEDAEEDDYVQPNEGPSTSTRSRLPMRPGAHLTLYVEETSEGVFVPGSYQNHACVRVSAVLFLCYCRGLWKSVTAADRLQYQNDPASRVADERDAMLDMLDVMRGRRYASAHGDWIAVENYVRMYHKGSDFAKWIQWCEDTAIKISQAQGTVKEELMKEACEKDNVPMKPSELRSLRQSCSRDVGVYENYGTTAQPIMIPGQGVGYPTMYAYLMAIAFFHRKLGLHGSDPGQDSDIRQMMATIRDKHVTEHVSVLDVLADLPFLRKAIMNHPDLTKGEKLMWWALCLRALEHGCRISDNTRFCPTLDQVGTPGEMANRICKHGYDSMGWPKWIEVTQSRWKGKRAKDPAITQDLHANVSGSAEYCSVAALVFLLMFYAKHGITEGPLFRKFKTGKKSGSRVPVQAKFKREDKKDPGVFVWFEEEHDEGRFSRKASLTEEEASKHIMSFFKSAAEYALSEGCTESSIRLEAATPHTFRATMVAWAARSRSSNAFNEARLAGRWKFGSVVFEAYWRLGMQISWDMVGGGRGEDKIFEFKPWPIGGTTNQLSRESAQGHGRNVSLDASQVNTRRRKGGQLDDQGKKRQKHRQDRKDEVVKLFKRRDEERDKT